MDWNLLFFLNSAMLGVGLAMDAFSVSLANGLNEPNMKRNKMCGIAGVFAGFQGLMPMIGWICVHTIVTIFSAFEKFIPWIALILLLFIGGKMLIEGIRGNDDEEKKGGVGFAALMVQGIATSIDALSVGFTIAEYTFPFALAEAVIIGIVTFGLCCGGLYFGRKIGERIAGKATIAGGIILILIGLEIFLTGIL